MSGDNPLKIGTLQLQVFECFLWELRQNCLYSVIH